MPQAVHPRFVVFSLLVKLRSRVGRRMMRYVGTLLALAIHLRIAATTLGLRAAAVLLEETLQ